MLNVIVASITIICVIIFFVLKYKRPETIWLGISFLAILSGLFLIIILLLLSAEQKSVLIVLSITFVIFLSILPLLVVGIFFVNGINLIKKEGARFTNVLSLLMACGLVFYLVIWPRILDITTSHFLNTIYQFVVSTVFYLSFILIAYAITNFFNLIHFTNPIINYYIVLGAGLRGQEVTPLLAGRINRAITLQKKQNTGKIIMSGGKGTDELIAEGEAMTRYAIEQGLDSKLLITENKSKNTSENIKFSKQLVDNDWIGEGQPKLAIVTNNYHVLRALMLARSQGLKCIGFGSKSKFYFSLNAFIREYVAYLKITYKVHTIILSFVAMFYIVLYFVMLIAG